MRFTFLVNVWLHYRPLAAQRLPKEVRTPSTVVTLRVNPRHVTAAGAHAGGDVNGVCTFEQVARRLHQRTVPIHVAVTTASVDTAPVEVQLGGRAARRGVHGARAAQRAGDVR